MCFIFFPYIVNNSGFKIASSGTWRDGRTVFKDGRASLKDREKELMLMSKETREGLRITGNCSLTPLLNYAFHA